MNVIIFYTDASSVAENQVESLNLCNILKLKIDKILYEGKKELKCNL